MANERARELRKNATTAERRLWYRLRSLKVERQKFRRQVPIDRFIVDFACLSHRLIIEVDGATYSTAEEFGNDLGPNAILRTKALWCFDFRTPRLQKT